MKNKMKIVAMATSIVSAIALIGGTLVMPVMAADDFSKEDVGFEIEIDTCEICGEIYDEWYTIGYECPKCSNKANHPGESEKPAEPAETTETTETESVMPLADDFSKEDTGFEIEIDPDEPEKPAEPVTPEKPEPTETIDTRYGVNEFAKEIVEITIELPDDYEDKTEVTVPDNKAEIEKLEAEAAEARQAADKARAEAERLEAIANEKEAALEAARQ